MCKVEEREKHSKPMPERKCVPMKRERERERLRLRQCDQVME